MTKIKDAFENFWKLYLFDKKYKKEDKKRYYQLFLDGYACALIDLEEKQK